MDYNFNDYPERPKLADLKTVGSERQDLDSELGMKLISELNFTRLGMKPAQEGASVSMENEGAIASALLERTWQRGNVENSAFRKLSSFHPVDSKDATIAFVQPQAPLSKDAAQAFHAILEKYSAGGHELNAAEIKSLELSLNRFNMGDNQHTNQAPAGDRYAPLFHMDKCRVEQLNGKAVLVVEGRFGGNENSPSKAVKAVLIDREADGQKIQALTFEAVDQASYQKHQASFEQMLRSIKWQKIEH